jgi:two-component system, NarL family, nitrate/nitrite response regulator NarL
MMPQTILVANGGQLFREGLARMLAGTQFTVHSETTTTAALALGARVPPSQDLTLLSCSGGTEVLVADLDALRRHYPDSKVVVLSTAMSHGGLCRAFAAGASGFLLEDICSQALIECLTLVAMGEKVFPTRLAELLVESDARSYAPDPVSPLPQGETPSQRELQILSCLVHGDSNKAIAKKLSITEATVKVHLKSALRKIRARNRTQAAVWMLNRNSPPSLRAPTPDKWAASGPASEQPHLA